MADRNNTEVSTLVWLPREPTTPESNERTHFAVSARASQHRGKIRLIVLSDRICSNERLFPTAPPELNFSNLRPHPLRANTIGNPGRLIATAAMAAFTFAGNASRAGNYPAWRMSGEVAPVRRQGHAPTQNLRRFPVILDSLSDPI